MGGRTKIYVKELRELLDRVGDNGYLEIEMEEASRSKYGRLSIMRTDSAVKGKRICLVVWKGNPFYVDVGIRQAD